MADPVEFDVCSNVEERVEALFVQEMNDGQKVDFKQIPSLTLRKARIKQEFITPAITVLCLASQAIRNTAEYRADITFICTTDASKDLEAKIVKAMIGLCRDWINDVEIVTRLNSANRGIVFHELSLSEDAPLVDDHENKRTQYRLQVDGRLYVGSEK